jgi:tetratricopeptide (TPR) repeat protein
MKSQRALWTMFLLLAPVWIGGGCKGPAASAPGGPPSSPQHQSTAVGSDVGAAVSVAANDGAVRTASEKQGDDKRSRMNKIWGLRKAGACEDLVASVDECLPEPAGDADTIGTCLFLKGDCQRRLGQYDQATKTLQQVLTKYKNASWADVSLPGGRMPVGCLCDVALFLAKSTERVPLPQEPNEFIKLAREYLDNNKFDLAIFLAWQSVTMEKIWQYRAEGRHRDIVVSADLFLKTHRDENRTATVRFLQGDGYRQLGEFEQAKRILTDVNSKYTGTFWLARNKEKIEVPPQCRVALWLIGERDKSRFPEDSNDYTSLAWKYLKEDRLDSARFMAMNCIERFRPAAEKQQEAHRQEYGDKQPVLDRDPTKNESVLRRYWALYDVGTCYFILGQACELKAVLAVEKRAVAEACAFYKDANRNYDIAIQQFPDAQCFDPSGPWYWSVKDGAVERGNRINDRMAVLRCL